MENKKSRRILFRTLLAVGTLLSSQQVFAYGCVYIGNTSEANAHYAAIEKQHITIIKGADIFYDSVENKQIRLTEFVANGPVSVKCGSIGLGWRNEPGLKRQGYTKLQGDREVVKMGYSNNLEGVYTTNIEGIGIISGMTNNEQLAEIGNESRTVPFESFPTEQLKKGEYTIHGRVALSVVIYDVNKLPTAGSYNIPLNDFETIMIYGSGNNTSDERVTSLFSPGDSASITIVNAACELPNPNIEVDLGEISPTEINTTSKILTDFNIELIKCPREVQVDYKFVNNNVDPGSSGELLLLDDVPGSAQGVGIQILGHDADKSSFFPLKLNNPPGAGSTGYTVAAFADPNSPEVLRNVSIPLQARYKLLHDHIPATPGKVKATAHFEVHYH